MERKTDDLSFEGAWDNQYENEKKTSEKSLKKSEGPIHEKPAFRGQRDIVEKRSQIVMSAKKNTTPKIEKKNANVVERLSSKDGDDFDVEW
ncbi:MAG: hypothetical protein QGI21_04225 [Candidatus Poseidoniaceae archaeon]|jgi:hypothetical protein|nr:hypothetical protein [Candidatus Poseidoniaceae archaeon]